jgi:hypothetical protein
MNVTREALAKVGIEQETGHYATKDSPCQMLTGSCSEVFNLPPRTLRPPDYGASVVNVESAEGFSARRLTTWQCTTIICKAVFIAYETKATDVSLIFRMLAEYPC